MDVHSYWSIHGTVLDLSTFPQFTESIQASNGGASESQVVGHKRDSSAVFVTLAESAVVEALTGMHRFRIPLTDKYTSTLKLELLIKKNKTVLNTAEPLVRHGRQYVLLQIRELLITYYQEVCGFMHLPCCSGPCNSVISLTQLISYYSLCYPCRKKVSDVSGYTVTQQLEELASEWMTPHLIYTQENVFSSY